MVGAAGWQFDSGGSQQPFLGREREREKKAWREVMKDVPESGRHSLNPFCKARLIGLHLKLKLAV